VRRRSRATPRGASDLVQGADAALYAAKGADRAQGWRLDNLLDMLGEELEEGACAQRQESPAGHRGHQPQLRNAGLRLASVSTVVSGRLSSSLAKLTVPLRPITSMATISSRRTCRQPVRH